MSEAFRLRPFTAADAHAIDRWRYPEPYRFYDLDQDAEDRAEFLDAANWPGRTFAVTKAGDELVGFFNFQPDGDTIEIGLGMNPAHTEQGWGLAFVRAGLAFARRTFAPARFRLSVATFNQRGITVYERAGFRTTRTFLQTTNGGMFEFIEMEKEENG